MNRKNILSLGTVYINIKTHRIIYMMFNDTLPKEIDHIDGNRLNNNIDNQTRILSTIE